MSEQIFMFDNADPEMQQAYAAAQQTFKYFWRELSWERRRIIPAFDMSMVKIPFSDGPRSDRRPEHEQMWVGEVDFDGETIFGTLLNSPNWLASVEKGDEVQVPFSYLTDWMMTADGKAYGGFTVNLMRARMGGAERKQHDDAWGLDFGDPATVQLEIAGARKPPGEFQRAAFRDRPMCINMLEKIEQQLKAEPSITRTVDDAGWTLLHREALAGNFGIVKLLRAHGAEVAAQTPSGKTAADLARGIGWSEIAGYLDLHK